MKKEYLIPLAIIIGTIIIGLSIYLGTTAEYRDKKAVCDEIWGEKGNENTGETFSAANYAVGATYSINLTDRFSIGFNGKYIQENIANKS